MSTDEEAKGQQKMAMREIKPSSIREYLRWLHKKHDVKISERDETYYYSVVNIVKRDFEKSSFWVQLNERLEEYDQEYLLKTGYNLLAPKYEPKIYVKPFKSLLVKTYRKNILENEYWPKEPNGRWILPDNWFSSINDIIRTLLVVKYFDGVNFMIDKIESLCKEHKMTSKVSLEAREEGYYAAHIHTQGIFEIPKITWDTEKTMFSIEIQVTTQIQEVLRRLLHKYYEKKRISLKKPTTKWQWDYECDEFAVNYLGHILHYDEGMILEIRERPEEREI